MHPLLDVSTATPGRKANYDGGRTSIRQGRSRIVMPQGLQAGERRPSKVCKYWLEHGACRKTGCAYVHEHSNMGTEVQLLKEVKGHSQVVRSMTVQPEPWTLYTGSQDGAVCAWNASLESAGAMNFGADVGAVLHQAGWLFVGIPNEIKTLIQATNAQSSLPGPQGKVSALHIISDKLLAACQDSKVLCWKFNPTTQAFAPHVELPGHSAAVVCLCSLSPAPGQEFLVSGSIDKSIKVWDVEGGGCLQTLANAHEGAITGVAQWNGYLLSCAMDGVIKVWGPNAQSGLLEESFRHPEPDGARRPTENALTMAVTRDGAGKDVLLVSYFNDISGVIRVYDLPEFNERGVLFARQEVRSMLVADSASAFVSGDASGDVRVWRFSPHVAGMQ